METTPFSKDAETHSLPDTLCTGCAGCGGCGFAILGFGASALLAGAITLSAQGQPLETETTFVPELTCFDVKWKEGSSCKYVEKGQIVGTRFRPDMTQGCEDPKGPRSRISLAEWERGGPLRSLSYLDCGQENMIGLYREMAGETPQAAYENAHRDLEVAYANQYICPEIQVPSGWLCSKQGGWTLLQNPNLAQGVCADDTPIRANISLRSQGEGLWTSNWTTLCGDGVQGPMRLQKHGMVGATTLQGALRASTDMIYQSLPQEARDAYAKETN